MTLEELQAKTDKWIQTLGVRYFDVQTNTLILQEEMGEFSRLVARIYGEQSFKKEIPAEAHKDMLADELADIIFVTSCLANQLDIDLNKAIEKNFEKKTNRDKTRHKNNPKLNQE